MRIKQKDTHFLFQSFISGIIEVGFVYYLWQLNYSVTIMLFFALLYQLANFLSSFFALDKKILSLLLIIFTLSALYIVFNNFNLYCLGFIFFILSFLLQVLRSEAKSNVSTFIKRTFRILGFINFYLFNFYFLLIISIYIFSMTFFSKYYNKIKVLDLKHDKILPSIIMLVHQSHYFLYCYIIMFFLLQSVEHILLYGLIFSLGWITYLLSEKILSKFNMYNSVVIGHLILGCNLLLLFFAIKLNISLYIIFGLWILTGFSAGTVFAIKDILVKNHYSINHIHFYENIGHVLGVLFSIIIVVSNNYIYNTIALSAFFAFLTAILTYILYRKNYARN